MNQTIDIWTTFPRNTNTLVEKFGEGVEKIIAGVDDSGGSFMRKRYHSYVIEVIHSRFMGGRYTPSASWASCVMMGRDKSRHARRPCIIGCFEFAVDIGGKSFVVSVVLVGFRVLDCGGSRWGRVGGRKPGGSKLGLHGSVMTEM
jgi:hypothetical protein